VPARTGVAADEAPSSEARASAAGTPSTDLFALLDDTFAPAVLAASTDDACHARPLLFLPGTQAGTSPSTDAGAIDDTLHEALIGVGWDARRSSDAAGQVDPLGRVVAVNANVARRGWHVLSYYNVPSTTHASPVGGPAEAGWSIDGDGRVSVEDTRAGATSPVPMNVWVTSNVSHALHYDAVPLVLARVALDGQDASDAKWDPSFVGTRWTRGADATHTAPLATWGDQDEVRMLELLVGIDAARFRFARYPKEWGGALRHNATAFTHLGGDLLAAARTLGATAAEAQAYAGAASTSQRNQDRQDFQAFVRDRVRDPGWRAFVGKVAFELATSMRCALPVFAHSGGGAVVELGLRVLKERYAGAASESPLAGLPQTTLVGLEGTFSQQTMAGVLDGDPYGGRITLQNIVVAPNGSDTWEVSITRELAVLSQRPVATGTAYGPAGDAVNGHRQIWSDFLESFSLPGVAPFSVP
jgi:hypothetical protein